MSRWSRRLRMARRPGGGARAAALGFHRSRSIMIETPAAALSPSSRGDAAFSRTGRNDLASTPSRWTRQRPPAPQVDALHPAVLRLIERTVAGARTRVRGWLSAALASDLRAFGAHRARRESCGRLADGRREGAIAAALEMSATAAVTQRADAASACILYALHGLLSR